MRIFAGGFGAGVFQSDAGGNGWAVNSLGLGDRAVNAVAAGGRRGVRRDAGRRRVPSG